MKTVRCAMERIQRMPEITIRIHEDATAEEIDDALIAQAQLDWSGAEIVETYPTGPRAIEYDEEAER